MKIHNVYDHRHGCIGSWEVEPLVYVKLGPEHIGRTVIYRTHGVSEAGTIVSWRKHIVYARYSRGDTAAGARPENLYLAIKSL